MKKKADIKMRLIVRINEDLASKLIEKLHTYYPSLRLQSRKRTTEYARMTVETLCEKALERYLGNA